MVEAEITESDRVFQVARRMVALGEEMWVSPEQYKAFVLSGEFTSKELDLFVLVRPWPYPLPES